MALRAVLPRSARPTVLRCGRRASTSSRQRVYLSSPQDRANASGWCSGQHWMRRFQPPRCGPQRCTVYQPNALVNTSQFSHWVIRGPLVRQAPPQAFPCGGLWEGLLSLTSGGLIVVFLRHGLCPTLPPWYSSLAYYLPTALRIFYIFYC